MITVPERLRSYGFPSALFVSDIVKIRGIGLQYFQIRRQAMLVFFLYLVKAVKL